MELALAIQNIYPNIIRGTDFDVLDDNQGEGPYIKWYNKGISQPTQVELETAWVEVVREQETENTKQQKAIDILEIATISDQLNLTAGTLDLVVDMLAEIKPELLEHPWIIESKAKLNGIKEVLNR